MEATLSQVPGRTYSYEVGLTNNAMRKFHHWLVAGVAEQEKLTFARKTATDPDQLILRSLNVNHHVSFVQNKHCDLL